jgi:SAM-dependent methyltransferase
MLREQKHGPDVLEGHLGGCSTGGDAGTYYPIMWKNLVYKYNISSVLDVGCGLGFALDYFKDLGCEIRGVEGSKQAYDLSLVKDKVVLHDYSKSSYRPEKIFDLCWSCEFVEHVEEKYLENFLETFKHAKYVAMTFAPKGQGGHHHVNEQPVEYWLEKLTNNKFTFLKEETEELRNICELDITAHKSRKDCPFFIPHFYHRGLFFKNDNI